MAKADGNATALTNNERLRAQIHGMITNNVSVTIEHAMTDVELVAKISGGDATLAVALRARLGTDNSFE